MNGETRPGPFLMQVSHLFFDGLHAADARADQHANAVGVAFRHVDTGIRDRFFGRPDRILREPIRAAGFLDRHELLGLEVLDFTADLAVVVLWCRIG